MGRGQGTAQTLLYVPRKKEEGPQKVATAKTSWSRIIKGLAENNRNWTQPPSVETNPYFNADAWQEIRRLRFIAVSDNFIDGSSYGFQICLAVNPLVSSENYQVIKLGEHSKCAFLEVKLATTSLEKALSAANEWLAEVPDYLEAQTKENTVSHFNEEAIWEKFSS